MNSSAMPTSWLPTVEMSAHHREPPQAVLGLEQ